MSAQRGDHRRCLVPPSNPIGIPPGPSGFAGLLESVRIAGTRALEPAANDCRGLLRLAQCHRLLNDGNTNILFYEKITRDAANQFFATSTRVRVNGNVCYNWAYDLTRNIATEPEDTGHSFYDVYVLRAYLANLGVSQVRMQRLANTARFRIYLDTNRFSGYIDGTSTASSPERKYLNYEWIELSVLDRNLYRLLPTRFSPAISILMMSPWKPQCWRRNITGRPIRCSKIMEAVAAYRSTDSPVAAPFQIACKRGLFPRAPCVTRMGKQIVSAAAGRVRYVPAFPKTRCPMQAVLHLHIKTTAAKNIRRPETAIAPRRTL